MSLAELRKEVYDCKKCELYLTKKKYVFGEGNEHSKIMFIGEAPGANEDTEGRPFVGKAGKILDIMLQHIKLDRSDVYITNCIKCRPPQNRDPNENELTQCSVYLNRQIESINPKIIVPLGNHALNYIVKKFNIKLEKEGISKVHGKSISLVTIFGNILIFPMYHPAIATYNPDMKEIIKKDFLILKTLISDK